MAKMLILPQSADEMFSESLALLQDIVHAERAAVFLAREGSETLTLVTYPIVRSEGLRFVYDLAFDRARSAR